MAATPRLKAINHVYLGYWRHPQNFNNLEAILRSACNGSTNKGYTCCCYGHDKMAYDMTKWPLPTNKILYSKSLFSVNDLMYTYRQPSPTVLLMRKVTQSREMHTNNSREEFFARKHHSSHSTWRSLSLSVVRGKTVVYTNLCANKTSDVYISLAYQNQ